MEVYQKDGKRKWVMEDHCLLGSPIITDSNIDIISDKKLWSDWSSIKEDSAVLYYIHEVFGKKMIGMRSTEKGLLIFYKKFFIAFDFPNKFHADENSPAGHPNFVFVKYKDLIGV